MLIVIIYDGRLVSAWNNFLQANVVITWWKSEPDSTHSYLDENFSAHLAGNFPTYYTCIYSFDNISFRAKLSSISLLYAGVKTEAKIASLQFPYVFLENDVSSAPATGRPFYWRRYSME